MGVLISKLKFCAIIMLIVHVPCFSQYSRLRDIANRDFKLWQYNQRMNRIDQNVDRKIASIFQSGSDKETIGKELDLLFDEAQAAKREAAKQEMARRQALDNFSRNVAVRYQRENPILGQLATVLLPRGL